MNPLTLRVIREEHRALSAVLRSILLLLAEHHRHGSLPDFAVLRAMLFYVDEFPERLHHPKESELLFPKLRARSPAAREILDRLDEDHVRGERAIRDLEHALLAFEMVGEARREAFEQMAERYVQGYLRHMETEEREVLPLALQLLQPRDWEDLDEAFAANRDPLTGHAPDEPYRAVIERILNGLPAPLGLAPAL